MSALVAKLEVVVRRHDEIQALLADHPEPGSADYTRLTREYAEMNPIVEQMRGFQKLVSDLDDAVALAEAEDDAEMRAMAEDEARELRAEIETKEQEMKVLLLPRDEADSRNAILEIRPGTGGDEAGLFAGDLLGMYRRFAEMQGWKFETIEMSENDVGGLKEVSVRISGTNVFAALKFESGVHRVQRVPVTESGGRIHTSAATVAVLPEAEEVDIEIRAEDIRIDTMRASVPAGSTSTPPTQPYASPTCPPASSSPRARSPSTATVKKQCGCCAPGCTRRPATRPTPNGPRTARARSAAATAPNASAPTTFRRDGSLTTASI